MPPGLDSSLPVVIKMQQEQRKEAVAPVIANDLPPCCGTGCAVCVLDYPELFSNCASSDHINQDGNQVDAETLAMLEAIEQAQAQAGKIMPDR